MKNLAIIPARSGSKGLPDKNIRELAGKPLLAYSIDAAKASGLFDEIMVSTDSSRYAEIAKAAGGAVPFLRSEENSNDKADSWDVVREVLNHYAENGQRFDTVCMLQPTSPLRQGEDIVGAYALLEQKNAEAITSVCEVDHTPLWSMTLDESGSLRDFRENLAAVPRQQLPQYYRLNGAIYIRKVVYTGDGADVLVQDEYAYIMDRKRSVDIDTLDDFAMAEFFMVGKL